MMGAAVGAVALSHALAITGWRPIFAATGSAGFVFFVLAYFFLREPASSAATADSRPVEHVRHSLGTVFGDGRVWTLSLVGLL